MKPLRTEGTRYCPEAKVLESRSLVPLLQEEGRKMGASGNLLQHCPQVEGGGRYLRL